jgi:telomeric repeat-binding factor 2-interacting protein 1
VDHWNDFWERELQQSNPELDDMDEEGSVRKMDKWIDDRVGNGKATSEEQVIQALQCTSMDPNLADKVLEYLVAGKGIPTEMRGVWTAEDDACLEGTDAREVERIHQKHGRDLVEARFEYLEFQREINLEGQMDGPD